MDAYIDRALAEMEAATAGLTDADLAQLRMAPGKWSAAATLEHLILTYTGTSRLMRRNARVSSHVPPANAKQRIATFVVVTLGHMPAGRKAPEFARPAEQPAGDVCPRFRAAIREMDAAIEECASKSPANVKIGAHPILGPLSAAQWRKFHFVHTRHHMNQLRAMRNSAQRAVAA